MTKPEGYYDPEVHYGPLRPRPRYHEDFKDDGSTVINVFNRTTWFYDTEADRQLDIEDGYCEILQNGHIDRELGKGDQHIVPARTPYKILRIIEKIGPCVVRETRLPNPTVPDQVFTEPTTV